MLIDALGVEAFGLFAIVASLPAYAGLLDFGIGQGLVKHLSEYSETDDPVGVRQVMTIGLAFYALIGLVCTPLVIMFAPAAIGLLDMPDPLQRTAETSIVAMFVYFVASSAVGVFHARVVSLHRMDIAAAAGLLGQIVFGVLIFVVIPRSPTVLTAIWLTMVQVPVTGVILYAVVRRTDRQVFCNPFTIPGGLVAKLFAFGGWMQLNSVTALVNLEADKLIIAGFLNIGAVTPYQIGNRLASLNRVIPFQLLSAIMPAATRVSMGRNPAAAEDFYCHTSRYLMLLTLAITGFTAMTADRLITTWIGRPYPQARLILLALSISFAINNLTGAGTTMVRAAGAPRYETYYAVVSMVLNIVLTVALAPVFGMGGILGGTIIANVAGSTYFIVLFHRRFGVPWYRTMGVWLWRLLAATAAACASIALLHVWEPADLATGRIAGLGILSAYGVVYLIVLAAGLTVLGFWSPADLDVLRRIRMKVRYAG